MWIHVFTHSIQLNSFFSPQFKKKLSLTFHLVSYLTSDIHIFWGQAAKESTAEFFPLGESGQSLKNRFDIKVWSTLNSQHLQGHFPTDHHAWGQHLSGLGPPVTHLWLMHKEYEHSKIWQLCTAWLYYVGNSVFTWKKEDKLFFL